jgi:hypothetical protein
MDSPVSGIWEVTGDMMIALRRHKNSRKNVIEVFGERAAEFT